MLDKIWQCLDFELLDSALFLAEQFAIIELSPQVSHAYALAAYRLGRYELALKIADNHARNNRHQMGQGHVGCAYTYALAALKLERYNLGIDALLEVRDSFQTTPTNPRIPSAAVCQTLLAKLYILSNNETAALELLSVSTRQDPLIFENVSLLCSIRGASTELTSVFSETLSNRSFSHPRLQQPITDQASLTFGASVTHAADSDAHNNTWLTNSTNGFELSRLRNPNTSWPSNSMIREGDLPDSQKHLLGTPKAGSSYPASASTPMPYFSPIGTVATQQVITSTPGPSCSSPTNPRTPKLPVHSKPTSTPNPMVGDNPEYLEDQATPLNYAATRKPSHASSKPIQTWKVTPPTHILPEMPPQPSAPRTAQRRVMQDIFVPKRRDRGHRTPSGHSGVHDQSLLAPQSRTPLSTTSTTRALAQVLDIYARVLRNMGLCACKEALRCLGELPEGHRNTASALSLSARAYYELMDHVHSAEQFEKVRKCDPTQIKDMDIYSTVLYLLKRRDSLAALASSMRDTHKDSWQTWCIIGNRQSLDSEYHEATVSFKKAIELNPHCSQAYCLLGHEHFGNENLHDAQHAFREGLRLDRRSYNAWYGLGMVHYTKGDLKGAKFHTKQALDINPENGILLGLMGTILQKEGQSTQARNIFLHACRVDPKATVAQFQLAEMHHQAGEYAQAIELLKNILKITPGVAKVLLLLARIYRQLDQNHEATRYYTDAQVAEPLQRQEIRREMQLDEV